jgi:hypothetical protein
MRTEPPNPNRRRFQFSLRSLMIFTLICAIPCAGVGWLRRKIERKRIEREWVVSIGGLGGKVLYDDEPGGSADRTESWRPDWLNDMLGYNFFNEVQYVDLMGKAVTDETLEYIASFAQLHTLNLVGTGISDSGLVNLEGLGHLHELYLANTKIGDSGLKNFKGLWQLQLLNLNGTKVSDSGLPNLDGLTNLRKLYLDRTNVTVDGVNELQKALPNCEIER